MSGAHTDFLRYGAIVRHRPATDVELTGFFGRYDYRELQSPVFFTAGAYLPDRVERRRYFGQEWSRRSGHAQNGGGIAKAQLGAWRIDAGLFHSRFTFDRYAADFLRDITPDGIGNRSTLAGRDQRESSISGEVRVSRIIREGPRLHRAMVSLRARRVESRYGGFGSAAFGVGSLGVEEELPEPNYLFGELTHDRVSQESVSLGYELRWPQIGEFNLGLTRSRYNKVVEEPGRMATRQNDTPWLWNAAVAITPTSRLAIYASTTRGLEESGLAPSNAANGLQALPALRTRQIEAGLRYALPGGLRLVGGVFDIRKPYFAIDEADNVRWPPN